MIEEVTMYRVVCDEDGCKRSAQDESDYAGWGEQFAALDEAENGDWYVGAFGHYCLDHAPRCICSVQFVWDDDYDEDGLCEDCAETALEFAVATVTASLVVTGEEQRP